MTNGETTAVGKPAGVHAGNCIGWAVDAMKSGLKVTRRGWNGRNMFLALQVPDDHSKMGLPYVYMKTVQGLLVPWLCSQSDLLATDWELVNE